MGFEVLQELLRRQHEVSFFSKRTYVFPAGLVGDPNFAYHDCPQPRVDSTIARLRGGTPRWLGMKIGNAIYMRRIIREMTRHHRAHAYDVELFLGQWAYGRVARLPVVSWVQGAPGSDSRSVRRHRVAIRALCGWGEYAKLRAYSGFRGSLVGRPPFRHTDVSICGSGMSRDILVRCYGIPQPAVTVLPYPLDLARFHPVTAFRSDAAAELLWVGRIVPRKRLDLFLEAGAHLIRAGRNVQLTVIGDFPFAGGYRDLIQRFAFPNRLTYVPRLCRDDVRARMQHASVLVAPSEEEDFGSSIAEALACGTPVVVGPSNGTADYIGAGGEQFGDYSAESVAQAIDRILTRIADDGGGVRAAAREAAVAHFTVGRVVDSLEGILRSATLAGEVG